MSDPLRAAIVANLQAVSGIGRVHAYQRWATDPKRLTEQYVSDGKLLGWHVRREKIQETRTAGRQYQTDITWKITGFRALNDADQSELEFDELIDAIRQKFRGFEYIGLTIKTENATGIQLEMQQPVLFGGVLCHSAQLSFTTRIVSNGSA